MMERSNVESVIVAGKVRKWKGELLDVDLRQLRSRLEDSRDFLYSAAGVPQRPVPVELAVEQRGIRAASAARAFISRACAGRGKHRLRAAFEV
jgi:hypothetical protein